MVDDFRPQRPQDPGQSTNQLGSQQGAFGGSPEPYVPPVETTTPSLQMPKKKSGAKKWLLWSIVVLLFAGLGAFAYWQWAEAERARADLNDTKARLARVEDELKAANLEGENKDTANPAGIELTEDEKISAAASAYYCNVINFGCDKATSKIDKKQAPTATAPGFAVVTATSSDTKTVTKLYLKANSTDDDWMVIYEGTAAPSADVVKKFGIPAGF